MLRVYPYRDLTSFLTPALFVSGPPRPKVGPSDLSDGKGIGLAQGRSAILMEGPLGVGGDQ